MTRRWRLLAFLAVAAAVAAVWRPWERLPRPAVGPQPPGTPDIAGLLDPSKTVTLVVVNRTGRPCKVTAAGGSPGGRNRMYFNLAAGEDRPASRVSGPFTVESVTVEQDGQTRKLAPNTVVPAGRTCEITVGPGDRLDCAVSGG
ncbi:MAG TPA: hypothetical protein VGF55_21365 [Gemmataceae bacterium]|jgi:hypothetical protein